MIVCTGSFKPVNLAYCTERCRVQAVQRPQIRRNGCCLSCHYRMLAAERRRPLCASSSGQDSHRSPAVATCGGALWIRARAQAQRLFHSRSRWPLVLAVTDCFEARDGRAERSRMDSKAAPCAHCGTCRLQCHHCIGGRGSRTVLLRPQRRIRAARDDPDCVRHTCSPSPPSIRLLCRLDLDPAWTRQEATLYLLQSWHAPARRDRVESRGRPRPRTDSEQPLLLQRCCPCINSNAEKNRFAGANRQKSQRLPEGGREGGRKEGD